MDIIYTYVRSHSLAIKKHLKRRQVKVILHSIRTEVREALVLLASSLPIGMCIYSIANISFRVILFPIPLPRAGLGSGQNGGVLR